MLKRRKRTLTKTKKAKKPSKKSLHKRLWPYFSIYIRHRDGFRCFTCGHFALKGMQAGHFIPSSYCGIGLRYAEDNVHAQCYACNIIKDGNTITYREKMVALYGEEHVKSMELRRHEITPDFDYEAKIKEYKDKCKALGLVP